MTVVLGGLRPTRTCVGVIWQVRTLLAIGRATGLARATVRKYAQAESFPERAIQRPAPSRLDPYLAHLEHAWPRATRTPWRSGARSATRALLELIGRCIATSPSGARCRRRAPPTSGCREPEPRARRLPEQNRSPRRSNWPGPWFSRSRRRCPVPRPTSLASGRMRGSPRLRPGAAVHDAGARLRPSMATRPVDAAGGARQMALRDAHLRRRGIGDLRGWLGAGRAGGSGGADERLWSNAQAEGQISRLKMAQAYHVRPRQLRTASPPRAPRCLIHAKCGRTAKPGEDHIAPPSPHGSQPYHHTAGSNTPFTSLAQRWAFTTDESIRT